MEVVEALLGCSRNFHGSSEASTRVVEGSMELVEASTRVVEASVEASIETSMEAHASTSFMSLHWLHELARAPTRF